MLSVLFRGYINVEGRGMIRGEAWYCGMTDCPINEYCIAVCRVSSFDITTQNAIQDPTFSTYFLILYGKFGSSLSVRPFLFPVCLSPSGPSSRGGCDSGDLCGR